MILCGTKELIIKLEMFAPDSFFQKKEKEMESEIALAETLRQYNVLNQRIIDGVILTPEQEAVRVGLERILQGFLLL